MSIIILGLIIFFILLIFYQLFLAHPLNNIFKRNIIEGKKNMVGKAFKSAGKAITKTANTAGKAVEKTATSAGKAIKKTATSAVKSTRQLVAPSKPHSAPAAPPASTDSPEAETETLPEPVPNPEPEPFSSSTPNTSTPSSYSPSTEESDRQIRILSEKDQQNTNTINNLNQQVGSLNEQVKGIMTAQASIFTPVV